MDSDVSLHDSLRYPMGRFARPQTIGAEDRRLHIAALRQLPVKLRAAVEDFSDEQLDTPYREGGWTVRQLVHHVADSHVNAYARMRLALTEDWPVVKTYDEARWAELADARSAPVAPSLALLDALHARWVALLIGLGEEDWKRGYLHPDNGRTPIDQALALYAWHGRHHVAHIAALRAREKW